MWYVPWRHNPLKTDLCGFYPVSIYGQTTNYASNPATVFTINQLWHGLMPLLCSPSPSPIGMGAVGLREASLLSLPSASSACIKHWQLLHRIGLFDLRAAWSQHVQIRQRPAGQPSLSLSLIHMFVKCVRKEREP